MKKTLLIALLSIPFAGFSQTLKPIDGALGVKFGSSKATVLATLKAKGGIIDDSYEADPNALIFKNLKYGSWFPQDIIVRFFENKACDIDFEIKPAVDAKVIEDYNTIVADLNEVYGKGATISNYPAPYKPGEGITDDLTGISVGKIKLMTTWTADNKNIIGVSISTDATVQIQYQDQVLVDQSLKSQKAKDKGDM